MVPYYDRAGIEGGRAALAGREIAWVDDPVELFFLQIQGSGRIALDTGETMRVGYAEQNGHPYRSIGRLLVERGELPLEKASMQGIKAWARANPGKLTELLNQNARYVFFRELPATGWPARRAGRALTPARSIAVDPRFVPLGAPVYIATTWPLTEQAAQPARARPGYRRRDSRLRARGFLLGHRRRRRARGRAHEAATADVGAAAQGLPTSHGYTQINTDALGRNGERRFICVHLCSPWPSRRSCGLHRGEAQAQQQAAPHRPLVLAGWRKPHCGKTRARGIHPGSRNGRLARAHLGYLPVLVDAQPEERPLRHFAASCRQGKAEQCVRAWISIDIPRGVPRGIDRGGQGSRFRSRG